MSQKCDKRRRKKELGSIVCDIVLRCAIQLKINFHFIINAESCPNSSNNKKHTFGRLMKNAREMKIFGQRQRKHLMWAWCKRSSSALTFKERKSQLFCARKHHIAVIRVHLLSVMISPRFPKKMKIKKSQSKNNHFLIFRFLVCFFYEFIELGRSEKKARRKRRKAHEKKQSKTAYK